MRGDYDNNEANRNRCTVCRGTGWITIPADEGERLPAERVQCWHCLGKGTEPPPIDWPEREQRPLDPARALEISVGGGAFDFREGVEK